MSIKNKITKIVLLAIILFSLISFSFAQEIDESIFFYYGDECGSFGNNAGADDLCMVDDLSAIKMFMYNIDGNITEEDTFVKLRNLLGNPGFEIGRTQFWLQHNGGSILIDSNNPKSGSYDLKVDIDAEGYGVESLNISLKPNTIYTFSADIMPSGLINDLQLDIELYDSSGSSLSENPISLDVYRTLSNLEADDSWYRRVYTFETPSNTAKGQVIINSTTNNPTLSDIFYIDNLQLEELAVPTSFFDNTFVTMYDYDSSDNLRAILSPGGEGVVFNSVDSKIDNVRLVLSDERVNFEYDGSNRVDYIDYGDSINTTYTYASGKITQMLVDIQNSPSFLINEIYDYTGDNLMSITQGPYIPSMTYDSLNRLKEYTNDGYVSNYPDLEFSYNDDGDIQFVTRDGAVSSYTYDANGRLTSVGVSTLTYDNNGNVISMGDDLYQYDYDNRLVRVDNSKGTFKYVYDSNNNKIMKGSQQGTNVYIYDYNGNIIYEESTKIQLPGFCNTDLSQGSAFVIKANGEKVFELDSGGVLQLKGYLYDNVEPGDIPSSTKNFDLKDTAGQTIFAVDEDGNLWLSGSFSDYQDPTATDNQDLIIKSNTGDIVAVFDEFGNLNLKNCLAQNMDIS